MLLLTDNETKVDLLNNEAIAQTIIKLLRGRPDRPVTVGVHGDWGAGKSSILEMVESGLGSEEEVLCLKFNGWRFQGFEDAKIALLEGIISEIERKRGPIGTLSEGVKKLFARIDWLKAAKRAGGLVLSYGPALVATLASHGLWAPGAAALGSRIASSGEEKASSKDEEGSSLLRPEETKTVPQQINAFRDEFDRFLESAGVRQFVVLIDDLDRCLPDTAIETLEAIRLFVFTARTAFVIAADEAMIAYAVRNHFPDLPDSTGPGDYARNYLEKLIQVPFRIPALGEAETRIYVTLLLVGAVVGEDAPGFSELIEAARERLRRPWEGGRLEAAALKAPFEEDHFSKIDEASMLSEQIGPILAAGTRGNPRQIKRFLNSLHLRHATAQARGFGGDVKMPVLAKLMLAERFEVRLFDQIAISAAGASDGRCPELKALEESAFEPPNAEEASSSIKRVGQPKASKVSESESGENAILSEWRASQRTQAWARLQPPLGEVDLRPYLFVAKDRKDYFGVSSLGHLVDVVERLLGSKIVVQGFAPKLKSLAMTEARLVFDELCSRILIGDSFQREPKGAAGLVEIVKAHPVLQMPLVEFLSRLPLDRLGPWVVRGWTGAITAAEAIERFNEFVDSLHTATEDNMVRAAIQAIRAKKTGR